MNLPDGSPVARAIADGFSNGNEQYNEATEPQRQRYDMAANAVISHLVRSTNEQIDAFSRIIDPVGYYEMHPLRIAKAREAARSIVKCLWLGPEQEALASVKDDDPTAMMRLATEVRDHVDIDWDGDDEREGP
jgi:hypothetical protein